MVNIRSKTGSASCFSRVVASVLAVLLMISLVPAAAALGPGSSLELKASAEGTELSAKAFVDTAGEFFALTGKMTSEGKTMLDGGLYVSARYIILQSAVLLGKTYGLDLTHYAENLASSVFAPDSGSTLAQDADTYAMLQGNFADVITTNVSGQNLEALQELVLNLTAPVETLIGAMEKPINELSDNLVSNAEISMKPGVLTLHNGEQKNVSLTAITFGPEAMGNAVGQLLLELEKDEEVKFAVTEIVTLLQDAGILTLKDDMADMTGEDLVEAVWQQLPEIARTLPKEMAEEKISVTFRAATEKATEDMVSIGVDLSAEGKTESLEVCFVQDAGQTQCGITFAISGQKARTVWITASEQGRGNAEYRFELVEEDKSLGYAALSLEPGKYSLTLCVDDETTVLSGRIQETADSLVITLDMVGQKPVENTYLALRTNDSIIVPQYTEVLSLGEEEMEALIATVRELAESVAKAD